MHTVQYRTQTILCPLESRSGAFRREVSQKDGQLYAYTSHRRQSYESIKSHFTQIGNPMRDTLGSDP